MPAYVQQVTTWNTTAGSHTAILTPAVNGLLVAIEGYSGGTREFNDPVSDNQGGTYTKIGQI